MNEKVAKAVEAIRKGLANIDWDESFFHKRLAEFETYDEIRMVTVERWKSSGLSGDEWRYTVHVEFYFKGLLVETQYASNINNAIMLVGHYKLVGKDPYAGIPTAILDLEKVSCDQVHCPEKATKWFALKRQTSDRGEWLDMTDSTFVYYRKFCDKHSNRGDCSREDNDENYVAITKIL